MSSDVLARRYLLGEASDDECVALEQEYFRNPEAADHIARVEEDLIEEYLDGRLPAADRDAFDRHYLVSPGHRARVETIRRLKRHRTAARSTLLPWLALAAALFVIIIGAVSLIAPGRNNSPTTGAGVQTTPAPPTPARSPAPPPAPPAPQVFALSLSPLSVRGEAGATARVIPAGTDVVSIRLEGESSEAALRDPRVSIATVEGAHVWTGAADSNLRRADGVVARAEVPARLLAPNDYIVRLFTRNAAGREREHARYFLRIRSR